MERLLLTADTPWEVYSMNSPRCSYYLVKGVKPHSTQGRRLLLNCFFFFFFLFLTGLPRLSGRAEANLQRIIKALKYSFNRVLSSKGLPFRAVNFDEGEQWRKAISFYPDGAGQEESSTTLKEELTWVYQILGLALSHTFVLTWLIAHVSYKASVLHCG